MQDYSDKRFLVVDDFNDFLSSDKAMLREMGARDVDTANRGEEAIAMCRQKRYDIILHDYNLGAGQWKPRVAEQTSDEDPRELVAEVLDDYREVVAGLEKLMVELAK